MTFDRSNTWYFLAFLVIGAILGAALGTLLVRAVPALAVITQNLTGPIGFNLEVISFSMKINLSSIVGMVFGIILFRKV